MEMVRVTLTDGTKREMTKDEMSALSLDGMMEAMDGKAIKNIEFYSESDN
jgi:hypothetical protein